MNLCRVLPNGTDAKESVDEAIDLASSIGNLRNDIHRCAHAKLLKGSYDLWCAQFLHDMLVHSSYPSLMHFTGLTVACCQQVRCSELVISQYRG